MARRTIESRVTAIEAMLSGPDLKKEIRELKAEAKGLTARAERAEARACRAEALAAESQRKCAETTALLESANALVLSWAGECSDLRRQVDAGAPAAVTDSST